MSDLCEAKVRVKPLGMHLKRSKGDGFGEFKQDKKYKEQKGGRSILQ
jgi:hypothetical protein